MRARVRTLLALATALALPALAWAAEKGSQAVVSCCPGCPWC